MKLILDTSAYSAFNRGDRRLKKYFIPENEILVPLIVIGELRAGFAAGNKRNVNEDLLQKFLDSPNVSTLTLTHETTRHFSEIYLQLRKAGTPVGTNDMWIAALSMENNTALLTLDADFSSIKGLDVVKLQHS